MVNQPTVTIFAGVNGAGKTTLYFLAQEKGIILGYRINVDEIAQSIGDYRDRQTQVRATRSHFPLFIIKAIRKRVSRAVIDRSVYP